MKKLALTIGLASVLLFATSARAEDAGVQGLVNDIIAVPSVVLTETGLVVCRQRMTETPAEHAIARKFPVGPGAAWSSCFQPRGR